MAGYREMHKALEGEPTEKQAGYVYYLTQKCNMKLQEAFEKALGVDDVDKLGSLTKEQMSQVIKFLLGEISDMKASWLR